MLDNLDYNIISGATKHFHESTPDNVVGVGYGYKYVDGKRTEDLGLVFTVKKKLPLDQIPTDERIPKEIVFSGVTLRTDVREGYYEKLQETCPSEFYNWENTPPPNRQRQRPLKGGCSTTNGTDVLTRGYVGTLGFIAIDNDTGSLVAISNNHVWVGLGFIGSVRNPNAPGEPSNTYNDVVVQPHPADGGGSLSSNRIGVVKKYVPWIRENQGYNYADACASTLDSSVVDLSSSFLQVGLTGVTQPLPFATSQEIDGLLVNGNPLFSSGRTTGAKGEGRMKLYCSQINANISLGVELNGVATSIPFGRTIEIEARSADTPPGYICVNPISGGDSGSALIADFNGVKKIVGLIFAGYKECQNCPTLSGTACRIDDVARLLNIRPWLGETNVNFSNPTNSETLCLPNCDQPYIDVDGKRFWQAGLGVCSPEQVSPTPQPSGIPPTPPVSPPIPTPPATSPIPVTSTPTPTITPTPTQPLLNCNVCASGYSYVIETDFTGQDGYVYFGDGNLGVNPNNIMTTGVYWNVVDCRGNNSFQYFSGITGNTIQIYFSQSGNTAIYQANPNVFTASIYSTPSGYAGQFRFDPLDAPSTPTLIQSASTNFVSGQSICVYYEVLSDFEIYITTQDGQPLIMQDGDLWDPKGFVYPFEVSRSANTTIGCGNNTAYDIIYAVGGWNFAYRFYTDETLSTPYNGQNLWFRSTDIDNTKLYQIDSTGFIISSHQC